MECPNCRKFLPAGSTSHQMCGWNVRPDRPVAAACGFNGCQQQAIIRHHAANLCLDHYLALHQVKAKDWCASRGLHTTEQMIEYCSPRLAAIYRKRNNGMVEF